MKGGAMQGQLLAYAESVGAGAVLAGLQAAYQAVSTQSGAGGMAISWQPVLAAFLLGTMGYLLAALRWLQTPPPAPAVPPTAPTTSSA